MQEGLYESLLTEQLQRQLNEMAHSVGELGRVDDAELPLVVSRHLAPLIEKTLRRVRDPEVRLNIVQRLLGALAEADFPTDDLIADAGGDMQQLLSVSPAAVIGQIVTPALQRPVTPLSDAALLTNARGEPTLAAELRAELDSVNGVDLLCAFVKWQGVRLLTEQFHALKLRGIPLRVLTTTYLGATDAKALDALVSDYGAEVRINYETNRTRLHAKAWLLKRDTGFDTAYVGSSNLSQAALVDGVEWNVRLSTVGSPALIEKFRTTFESYWENREFEPYNPSKDGDRLRRALEVAGGQRSRESITLSGLEVRPLPHQAEILEELDAERSLHDRHRNLVIAATGTGKTVVAALDYRRLVRETYGKDLTLLFVAHRLEILRQSQRMYQEIMVDATFGELWVAGEVPRVGRHVFASIQSLSAAKISALDSQHYDVVVIDEFHHAQAASYRRLIDHVRPLELLALTATPERGDGVDVRTLFDGRTAAELRLWDALDQNLLCPFHYFGIHDGTDLANVAWRRGSYDAASLNALYTGNDTRTRIVLKEVRDKVSDASRMRALGFCASTAHARYMAQRFDEAGIPARAVWADTSSADRADALRALRNREINALFAVDLFNEGLDIPEVDTVLFLRPTESSTIFLQQLGRGLRMTEGKSVLTVLDFVGHQRREFRFDQRFRALTGTGGKKLEQQVQQGFPFLPSGSQIVLDVVTRDAVLANIRQQVSPRWAGLVSELRQFDGAGLADFLEESGRDLPDIIKKQAGRSWTFLCREAGRALPEAGPREMALGKRVRALAHVDDALRAAGYGKLLSRPAAYAELSLLEQRLARMLFFSMYPDGGGFADIELGLGSLAHEPAMRSELHQVVDIAFDRARRSTYSLSSLSPGLTDIPLAVHGSYQREEILAALDYASIARKPSTMREGVAWCESVQSDALLITIKKSEKQYSPTTMYKDYALSQDLFHWESQSTTSAFSTTGQRYINHQQQGTNILVFMRPENADSMGAVQPYVFLGPADYVSHVGDRPMAITWKLRHSMPTEAYLAARVAIA